MKTKPKTTEYIKKELFDMVYQWGRVGIVVDENAPAFNSVLDELVEAKYKEELWIADERWKANEKYREQYYNITGKY